MTIFYEALAQADAETQAEFFNGFYRHLRVCCKGHEERQISYIADHLDENGRKLAEDLQAFALLAVETRAKLEISMQELYRHRHELENELAEKRKTLDALEEIAKGKETQ